MHQTNVGLASTAYQMLAGIPDSKPTSRRRRFVCRDDVVATSPQRHHLTFRPLATSWRCQICAVATMSPKVRRSDGDVDVDAASWRRLPSDIATATSLRHHPDGKTTSLPTSLRHLSAIWDNGVRSIVMSLKRLAALIYLQNLLGGTL